MTLAATYMPLYPALPEILLALGAMGLLMVGVYRERSNDIVSLGVDGAPGVAGATTVACTAGMLSPSPPPRSASA